MTTNRNYCLGNFLTTSSTTSLLKRWSSREPDSKLHSVDIWDDVMTNRYIVARTHGHTSSLAKTTKTKFDVSSEVHSISVYIFSSSDRSYVFVRFFIALPTLGGDIKRKSHRGLC